MRYDPLQDAYALLGVRPDAADEAIEDAYRAALLKWHPDKNPAPDAAEHFMKVLQAGKTLRDPRSRSDYDRLRRLHHGPTAKKQGTTYRRPPPKPYVPMRGAPASVETEHQLIQDSVLFQLRDDQRNWMRDGALISTLLCLGAAGLSANMLFGLLALVSFAVMRIATKPPTEQRTCWARLTPARKEAECVILDSTSGQMTRYQVPFRFLRIRVLGRNGRFRAVIEGLPVGPVPLASETRHAKLAERCAREAGAWLQLPWRQAA